MRVTRQVTQTLASEWDPVGTRTPVTQPEASWGRTTVRLSCAHGPQDRKRLDVARPHRRTFYNSSRLVCQKREVGGAGSGRARFSLCRGAKSECVGVGVGVGRFCVDLQNRKKNRCQRGSAEGSLHRAFCGGEGSAALHHPAAGPGTLKHVALARSLTRRTTITSTARRRVTAGGSQVNTDS